jgi:beta-galactosidase/beta-glucuronidase
MKRLFLSFILFCLALILYRNTYAGVRKNVSLNGTWDITESVSGNKLPNKYGHKIIVPGFVDMTSPSFDSTGLKCSKRNYYWYRRFFKINNQLPQVVLLKINKAVYGTDVYLNGKKIGSNLFCFTPTLLDIKKYLKPAGKQNELLIRVGAYYDSVPDSIPVGMDFEKIHYLSGIYDDVEIISSGFPFIENVQIVPDIINNLIKVRAEIRSDKDIDQFVMHYSVIEQKSSKEIISGETTPGVIRNKNNNIIEFTIPLNYCHLWSPEDPFMYELNVSTGQDTKNTSFGMRSFRFDAVSNHAILNGKPYSMLGTNICFFRFAEDSCRGDLPWNEKWVRKMFQKFKGMNWNCIRYCIGFPPEKWYQIADETGFLIQDEYPLWGGPEGAPKIKSDVLIEEYTRWMRERWNHPCVVIWDAENETATKESGKAVVAVRHLDLSNRPWDNGWGVPQSDGD